MRWRRALILRHPDFRRLWIGESLSQVGGEISGLAIPLIAVLVLHASTFAVGMLSAVHNLAFLLLGLPAGAWLDRMRRRPVMIAGDLLRAALLASVPVAAYLHRLTMVQLYVVVCAVGVGNLFFDIAYQSYLPALVGREDLVAGNGALEASRSVAHAAGPGAAGALVQAVTAPVAVIANAAGLLWSALWLRSIRYREPAPRPAVARRHLGREIAAGLRLVFGHPVLRALGLYGGIGVLALSIQYAIDVVFLVRVVGLSPAALGLLFTVGTPGAVIGALIAAPLAARLGPERTMLATATVAMSFRLLIPLTAPGPRLALYPIGSGVAACGIVAFNVVAVAYRQRLCPDHLLGRMNATIRFLSWGALPLGAVAGGALGAALGLRPTLWLSAGLGLAAALWLLRSPLRHAGRPGLARWAGASRSTMPQTPGARSRR